MADKAKSNAEVAAQIVQAWALNDRNDPHEREALEGRIESALATAQSQLAGEVLREAARYDKAISADRLRDFFTRMGIKEG